MWRNWKPSEKKLTLTLLVRGLGIAEAKMVRSRLHSVRSVTDFVTDTAIKQQLNSLLFVKSTCESRILRLKDGLEEPEYSLAGVRVFSLFQFYLTGFLFRVLISLN